MQVVKKSNSFNATYFYRFPAKFCEDIIINVFLASSSFPHINMAGEAPRKSGTDPIYSKVYTSNGI